MSIAIINPLKKEVENLSSYKELLSLNEARIKKIMGVDNDWMIYLSDSPTPTPSPAPTPTPIPSDNQVYQSLQAENEWAWDTIKLLNEGWFQNKLWLDSVEDEAEADQMTTDLLKAVVVYWRSYLESDDKEIFKKMPVLGSRLSKHEHREKASYLVTQMDKVLYKEIPMEKLLTEWNEGKDWSDYNKKYDYDNSLWAFTQLLWLKKKYQAEKQEITLQPKIIL